MKQKITAEQFAKLPKWAQEYVRDLETERRNAVEDLKDFCESQKPSRIYTETLDCSGSFKRNYIQDDRVIVEYAGIKLRIMVSDERLMGIRLMWDNTRGTSRYETIGIHPTGSNTMLLINHSIKEDDQG